MGMSKDQYHEEICRSNSDYDDWYGKGYNAGYAAAIAKIKAERRREIELMLERVSKRPERTGSIIPANVEAANKAVAK